MLLLCVLPHVLWRILPWRSPWPRIFLGLAARAVGARVEIRGKPLERDVFFVANHLSWIDILAMGGATGHGATLLPFKPALLSVMLPPPRDLNVQPVYIDYGTAASEIAWHEPSLATNALRVLTRPGNLLVTLHFLPPFDPKDFPDRKMLAAECRKRISTCLPPIATHPSAV